MRTSPHGERPPEDDVPESVMEEDLPELEEIPLEGDFPRREVASAASGAPPAAVTLEPSDEAREQTDEPSPPDFGAAPRAELGSLEGATASADPRGRKRRH